MKEIDEIIPAAGRCICLHEMETGLPHDERTQHCFTSCQEQHAIIKQRYDIKELLREFGKRIIERVEDGNHASLSEAVIVDMIKEEFGEMGITIK